MRNLDAPLGTTRQSIKRRKSLIEAIEKFWQEHGYSPSIRDLVKGSDYTSTSEVSYALVQLRDMGLLTYDDEIARSIRLLVRRTCPCCGREYE